MSNYCVIDIQPRSIAAVTSGGKGGGNVASEYVSKPYSEETFSEVLEEVINEIRPDNSYVIVNLSPKFLTFVNIFFPFTDKKKVKQVLPFELDNMILGDIATYVYDYECSEKNISQSNILVALAPKHLVENLLNIFSNCQIDPFIIGISGQVNASLAASKLKSKIVFIDNIDNSLTVFIYDCGILRNIRYFVIDSNNFISSFEDSAFLQWLKHTVYVSGIVNVRNYDFKIFVGNSVKNDLVDVLKNQFPGLEILCRHQLDSVQSVNYSEIAEDVVDISNIERIVNCSSQEAIKLRKYNFRTQEFTRSITVAQYSKKLRYFGLPILLLLIITFSFYVNDFFNQRKKLDHINNNIVSVFRAVLPEVKTIISPLQQLQIAIKEKESLYLVSSRRNKITILQILTDLSRKIAPDTSIKITRLLADSETIRILGVAEDFNTVDKVQKLLENDFIFKNVFINSANQSPETNQITFEIKMDLVK